MKSSTSERLRQVAADPFIGDAVMADYLAQAADEIGLAKRMYTLAVEGLRPNAELSGGRRPSA
jgi:hypothetical protein